MKKFDPKSKRPPQGQKSGFREFIRANRSDMEAAKKSSTSFFHDETKDKDQDELSPLLVKNARSSGTLNLSGRNLVHVPAKVWSINELDKKEQKTINMSLDCDDKDKWWDFVSLSKLILANNRILEIHSDIRKLNTLQTLDIHDNQLTAIPQEICELELLTKLDLSHNKIQCLPNGIYNLRRLTELKLDHNAIESIHRDVANFDSLRILDLSHNKLTNVPGDLGFLSLLTNLNISNNQINNLSIDLNGLTSLRTFDASENFIEKLLPELFNSFTHLEILYLQNNKIINIPNFTSCSNLKELHMQHNYVKDFSSERFTNTKISLIDLRYNKIFKFDVHLNDLEFVDRFYLENNDIAVIPDDLPYLPSLKQLTLDGNPLRGIRVDVLQRGTVELLKYLKSRIAPSQEVIDRKNPYPFIKSKKPEEIESQSSRALINSNSLKSISSVDDLGIDIHRLKSKQVLNLSSRQIKELEENVFLTAASAHVYSIDISKNQLDSLPNSFENTCQFLTELNLDFNRLSTLPSCIVNCEKLTYLSFQSNMIANVPEGLSNLSNLREINFACNKFTSIPESLYKLPNLEILIGSENKIVNIEHEKLRGLKKLAVLDLSNNNITQIPPEVALIDSLRSLNISGNAFRVPGHQILSQGTPAILRYLQNRIVQK